MSALSADFNFLISIGVLVLIGREGSSPSLNLTGGEE